MARERKAGKPVQPVKDELHDYLSLPVDDDVEDNEVLTWWAKRESEYPHLSHMARYYLSTPGEFISRFLCFLLICRLILSFRNFRRGRESIQQRPASYIVCPEPLGSRDSPLADVPQVVDGVGVCQGHRPASGSPGD